MMGQYGEDGYFEKPTWYKCPMCGEYLDPDSKVFWIQEESTYMCRECMTDYMAETLPTENTEDIDECKETIN
mgnify:CR=1 FL=1